jgi:hypothetical protein
MKFTLSILIFLAACAGFLFQNGCETPAATYAADEAVQVEETTLKTQPIEQPPQIPESVVEQAAAEITFDHTVHDFGDILNKSQNTCEFNFKNTGNSELVIGKIKRTCGCTVFELPKKNYAPGESGKIKVQYTASSVPGTSAKHLYVPSNARNNPRVELAVKANITLKVKAVPSALSFSLDKENAGCPPINLSSTDGKPFNITNFYSTNETVTAEFDPNVAANKFVLHPKVDTEKLGKRLNGHISINLTHPQCNKVNINYSTTPQFETEPVTIIIQNADPTKPIKKQVLVKNNYGRDFEIESVYSEKGTMHLLSQNKVEQGIQLEIQIEPPPQARKIRFFTDWLYIQTNRGERVQIHTNMWFAKVKEKQQNPSG